jgi:hypothetical protein
VIGPWNFPITNSFGDCIPALAAGNSVILKPSEVTPLSSLLMEEMLRECGLPDGVFQVATGDGSTGASLIGAVDCLQLDVTRCGGITGLLQLAGLAAAHSLDVSGHCAPQLSAHALCAVPNLRHLEYFHDHVRVERMLFDGVFEPEDGCLRPDRSRPGHGLELRTQ